MDAVLAATAQALRCPDPWQRPSTRRRSARWWTGSCRCNVAVHFGPVYLGQIVTGGRLEISGLGQTVSTCARQLSATRDGALLVSKTVVEQLDTEDAAALELDPLAMRYQLLGELPGADDKVRRDAGTLLVTTGIRPGRRGTR